MKSVKNAMGKTNVSRKIFRSGYQESLMLGRGSKQTLSEDVGFGVDTQRAEMKMYTRRFTCLCSY